MEGKESSKLCEATKIMEKMVVKVVSKEHILPISLTPDHLRTFKLSVLDQTQIAVYIPLILFYCNSNTSNIDSCISSRSQLLKQALAQTLTRFYPLAGKVRDHLHIDCNDEGVYYIETRVNNRLSDFLTQSPEDELINQLIPHNAIESPIGNYVLSIQVNFFSCGGIAICTSINHKFIDGSTYMLFLKDWTAATRGSTEKVSPSFTAPSLFPQIPSLQFESPVPVGKIKFVTQRLVFDGLKIASLKNNTGLGKEATRFEVVAALLWKCIGKAAHNVNDSILQNPYNLGMLINLRGKNSLANNLVGNLVWPGLAQCKLAEELEHRYLVDQIKKCKSGISDDFIEVIKGDKGTPTIIKCAKMIMNGEQSFSLWITSMCNMGVYELDFGYGKPVWYYYGNVSLVNFISMCDTRAGGGIQAVVSLTKQEMDILLNDTELLSFASLNPAPI